MIQGYNIKNTISEEKQFIFTKKFDNGLQFYTQLVFESDNLIDYQKDILNDYIGNIIDKLSNKEDIKENEIKKIFETSLQELNAELQKFADKLKSSKFISLKGISRIVYKGLFLASMIGDTSILIFRDDHIYYKVYNNQDDSGRITTFSDFIDGELEYGDRILIVSTDYNMVLTKNDFNELNSIIGGNIEEVLNIFYQIFISKIDESKIGFLTLYDYNSSINKTTLIKNTSKSKILNNQVKKISKRMQYLLIKNKYPIVVSFLSIFVLIIGYNIISDIIKTNDQIPQIQTNEGVKKVTIESIRRDIDRFQKIDSLSNEKSIVYKEIMEEIKFLEEKKMWIEDVNKLKNILKNKYYEGFNVAFIDKTSPDIKPIYTFSSQEIKTLGNPVSLLSNEIFTIGGSKGSILGAVNNEIKGTLIDANIESNIKKCTFDFARNGLFCFTDTNKLLHITKGGIYDMSVINPDNQEDTENDNNTIAFDGPIKDLSVYRKNSLYILHKDPELIKEKKYITKYLNIPGNSNLFKPGIQYKIVGSEGSGIDLGFNDFTIDTTFLSWSTTKQELYQLRRDKGIDTINARKINIQGGNIFEDNYSNKTKVITHINTKYVYFFDPMNQTFTVYRTSPQKTNDKFLFSYNLIYVMRFKFDLLGNNIIDASVPERSGNKPYLYLLTKKGIMQIDLAEFIKKYEEE